MKLGISVKIDVTKIDKARLFQGKNGAKYLDVTTFVDLDEKDQYGNNGFITQDVSKQERDNGVKGPILGNTKVFYNDSQTQSAGGFQQQQGGFRPQPQAVTQNAQQQQSFQPQAIQNGSQQAALNNMPIGQRSEPHVDFDDDIPF